jgi:hypothetical protein
MRAPSLTTFLFPIIFAGCGTTDLWLFDCPNPEHEHLGPDGGPDPCHYSQDPAGPDAAEPEPPCADGTCIMWPIAWQPPAWLWIGPPGYEPECEGPSAWDGNAGLIDTPACEECSCKPPSGRCQLPTELTVSTAACNQPGGTSIQFDAPDTWGGACDTTSKVPVGANSLTVSPLVKEEDACEPHVHSVPKVAPERIPIRWETSARACHGQDWKPVCGDVRATCIPHGSAPPGFQLCIMLDGDNECLTKDAEQSWPEKHLFYGHAEDQRHCTECTCGQPSDGMCVALLSVYEDTACNVPVEPGFTISSEKNTCIDIPPGQALTSKAATLPTYIPGACEPEGGAPVGEVVLTNLMTFCCKPN